MKLVVAVSQVGDGDMSILYSGEEVAMANRQRFIEKQGLDFAKCVHTYVKHREDIQEVTSRDGGKFLDVDGLVTREPGVGLVIVTADCIPLVYHASMHDTNVVALVHVSRKNVGIVNKLVKKLGNEGRVWIGPCIKKESYVWPNRNDLGPEWDEFVEQQLDGWHIDLVGRIVQELKMQGIKMDKIELSDVDTGRDPNYFSHHRSMQTGESEGRFMTVATLK